MVSTWMGEKSFSESVRQPQQGLGQVPSVPIRALGMEPTPKQKAGHSPWSPEAPEDSASRNHAVHGDQEPRALGPRPQVPAAGGADV